jgi:hypothetical protein
MLLRRGLSWRGRAVIVARRSLGSESSPDLTVTDLVPPGSDHVVALEAFTLNKILGNRLGYAWRVDRKAAAQEPRFHYDRVSECVRTQVATSAE